MKRFIIIDPQLGRRIYEAEEGETCHRDIAQGIDVSDDLVMGGGFIDHQRKVVIGTSGDYGDYNPQDIQKLLPDYKVYLPCKYCEIDQHLSFRLPSGWIEEEDL